MASGKLACAGFTPHVQERAAAAFGKKAQAKDGVAGFYPRPQKNATRGRIFGRAVPDSLFRFFRVAVLLLSGALFGLAVAYLVGAAALAAWGMIEWAILRYVGN